MTYKKTTKRIPIPEYLDKLIIRRTRGNDAIRVYEIKNFLRSKMKNKSLKEFSILTNTKYKNVQNWLETLNAILECP